MMAGKEGFSRSGRVEAGALKRKGLALRCRLPGGARRQEHELDLQIAVGQALTATQGPAAPVVGETFAGARQLSASLKLAGRLLAFLIAEGQYPPGDPGLGKMKGIATWLLSLRA